MRGSALHKTRPSTTWHEVAQGPAQKDLWALAGEADGTVMPCVATTILDCMNEKPIVVGYDNSPDAELALRWAVELAPLLERPLRVVVARGDLYKLSKWADEWTRGLADEWTDFARKQLVELGFVGAELAVVDGLAAEVLVQESRAAFCLAIGCRGHGRIAAAFQGSVSQHVSRQADCPVVVVRPHHAEGTCRVVVGVDGSESSMQALEFALHYAGMHRFLLTVLHSPEPWQGPGEPDDRMRAALGSREAMVLARAADVIAGHEGVNVEMREAVGRPADELVDASYDADLVVVGSRGRGAFAGMLLGSVSAEVLRHARCPVAVIR